MTSEAKIKSNRSNARSSTGPKTHNGRARSARNALRHGLSISVCSDPALSEEVETLAREIAGPDANPEISELARRVAEAQIDLHRVRYARRQLLSKALKDPYYESRADGLKKLKILARILQPSAPAIPLNMIEKFLTSTPRGPYKLATILSEEAKQLHAMDRYERRALSRRKFAVQALDAAKGVPIVE